MAELEIHHEGEHAGDPMGRRVGILAAILAVLLAVVTIASHRTHTASIMHKSSANDAWAHYQATRVKLHSVENLQCRKWRTPVNTIAAPSRSAAAMTSASRTLPPG